LKVGETPIKSFAEKAFTRTIANMGVMINETVLDASLDS